MGRDIQSLLACVLFFLLGLVLSPIDLASAHGIDIPRAESTIEQAVDRNGNCIIEDPEILQAVEYWITGSPVPGTLSLTVDDVKILELVGLWISGECFSPTPLPVGGAFLELINQHRRQSDRCWDLKAQAWGSWPREASQELTISSSLNQAAVYHSQFMADHDCFAHQCPGEADLPARMEQFAYRGGTAYGENIAAGVETPEAVFELWRGSPPHNRNMLACQFEELGVGRVYDPGDRYPSPRAPYRWYWTTDFGSPHNSPATGSAP